MNGGHGVKAGVMRRLKLKDTWVVCYVLGFIMMNYPFLSIFNKPRLAFAIPLLYLYLLSGWIFSIFIVFLFSRAAGRESKSGRHP